MVKVKRKLAIPRGAEGGGGGGEIMSKRIKVSKVESMCSRSTTITSLPLQQQQRRDMLEESDSCESRIEDTDDGPESGISPEEILRRHFESQFAPLEEDEEGERGGKILKSKRKRGGDQDEDEDEDGDGEGSSGEEDEEDEEYNSDEDRFEGFSDISEQDAYAAQSVGLAQSHGDAGDYDSDEEEEEDEEGPEVVDYTGSRFAPTSMLSNLKSKTPKSEIKAFMSHKIPTLLPTTAPALAPNPTAKSKSKSKSTNSDSDSDPTETLNLKNDLALQRLLLESHLLDPLSPHSTSTSATLNPTGKNRHRAINTRIQSLGGNDITKHRMPVKMKHGIAVANEKREVKRRKVARDGGVILEKKRVGEEERRKKKEMEEKRRGGGMGAGVERGFGKPSVGRFRNGALVLSKKDVREIEGSGGSRGVGGGRKGGKKGGMKGGKGKKR